MTHFDLPLDELWSFKPDLAIPADFDDFWASTLTELRSRPLDLRHGRVATGLRTVETYDLSFTGWGGARIAAWLVLPAHREPDEKLPAVVEYIGYNGGRGLPHERLTWASAGYAHLVMDTRGQGSGHVIGTTPDPEAGSGPSVPGFMTKGITDPADYYYRRLFSDAVRAVDVARELPEIDNDRITVAGGSQGGGITLAVAGLVPGLMAAMVDVPFLCSFRRATEITDNEPYAELVRYLAAHRDQVERVFDTLAYFDGVHLGSRATAPALFSVALRDQTCPPSTVFAAHNHYAGSDKDIRVWHYNEHEGGAQAQVAEQLAWLAPRAANETARIQPIP